MSWASERTSSPFLWNHNLQFHRWILEQMPAGCKNALDVGCGDGVLTLKLAARATRVTGIDIEPEMIALARQGPAGDNITYVIGDILSSPLPVEGFDFIAAVAVIHHMPLEPALARCASLLERGGVLVAVGLARSESPLDYAYGAASIAASRLIRLRKGWWESPAERVDPGEALAEIRNVARRMLPGVEVRRRLFFRYTLLWRKP